MSSSKPTCCISRRHFHSLSPLPINVSDISADISRRLCGIWGRMTAGPHRQCIRVASPRPTAATFAACGRFAFSARPDEIAAVLWCSPSPRIPVYTDSRRRPPPFASRTACIAPSLRAEASTVSPRCRERGEREIQGDLEQPRKRQSGSCIRRHAAGRRAACGFFRSAWQLPSSAR